MSDLNQVRHWLEAGKQVGRRLSYTANGEAHWLTVGVQKWQGSYKINVTDYLEEGMTLESEPVREETVAVASYEELELFFATIPAVSLAELAPLKGLKVFNPAY